MGRVKNIEWKNIYYFLCYAIDELELLQNNRINFEDIEGVHDLLATLLINTFEPVYKNGYLKVYKRKEIVTDRPHGILNIPKSIRTGAYEKGKLVCSVDCLDINNELNQIIKAAFNVLIDSNNVVSDKINKNLLTDLINLREMLNKVDNISISKEILYKNREIPEVYRPVIVVSKFILDEWLALDGDGKTRFLYKADPSRMCRIWEKFLRNFFIKEMPGYLTSKMNIPGPFNSTNELDIVSRNKKNNNTVIMDAKWYEDEVGSKPNLFQIDSYTVRYIKIYPKQHVTGLLIYASTDSKDIKVEHMNVSNPEGTGIIDYNLAIKPVGINKDFELIKQELKDIVNEFLKNT